VALMRWTLAGLVQGTAFRHCQRLLVETPLCAALQPMRLPFSDVLVDEMTQVIK
jgi:hypothetical protein